MGDITLITGGAGSGKSSFACEEAKKHGDNILFIATCDPRDDEMKAKVEKHRRERPATWKTLEIQWNVGSAIVESSKGSNAIIIDCLTLLISQMLVDNSTDEEMITECRNTFKAADQIEIPVLVVTNEVGSGVVPDNQISRRFIRMAGQVNIEAVKTATKVFHMVSGIPNLIKGTQ